MADVALPMTCVACRVAGFVRASAAAVLLFGVACAPALTPLPPREAEPAPAPHPPTQPPPAPAPPGEPAPFAGRPTRVALAPAADTAVLDAAGQWEARTLAGTLVLRAEAGERWRVLSADSRLAFTGPGGRQVRSAGAVRIRPTDTRTLVRVDGRRYRGEISLTPDGNRMQVINTLGMEDYLRGVVPLEIGNRPAAEQSAAEAQAIAARTYAYVRVRAREGQPYDLVGTVMDQVYGGVEAERPTTDAAVLATAGLVLVYAGELADAPYHSTCGGSTAGVAEVWHRQADRPHLRPVSDRIPGTDRYWCQSSAMFSWTRTLEQGDLNATVARYLRNYAAGAPANPGAVRDVIPGPRTASGRMASVTVVTGTGRYILRGDDIRWVMRSPAGQILPSTYFSHTMTRAPNGTVRNVVFQGNGNGHGIGMCQWGAIGRSRAGHSASAILAAYYVGTTLARIDEIGVQLSR